MTGKTVFMGQFCNYTLLNLNYFWFQKHSWDYLKKILKICTDWRKWFLEHECKSTYSTRSLETGALLGSVSIKAETRTERQVATEAWSRF